MDQMTGLAIHDTDRLPAMLTDRDVARIMGFGVQKVRRLMAAGEIPGRKFGKYWRTSASELQQFLDGTWQRKDDAA